MGEGNARAQDHQCGGCAEQDGVHKDLHDSPNALRAWAFCVRRGVCRGRRSAACLVGEQSAHRSHAQGTGGQKAEHAPYSARRLKGVPEDRGKRLEKRLPPHDQGGDRENNVSQRHHGHEQLGHAAHGLAVASFAREEGKREEQEQKTAEPFGKAPDPVERSAYGVDLDHAPHRERIEQEQKRKDRGEDRAKTVQPLFLQQVAQIVDRTAKKASSVPRPAMRDRQKDLGVFEDHGKEGGDPHPKDRSGSAYADRARHAHDVAHAKRPRKGKRHRAKGGGPPPPLRARQTLRGERTEHLHGAEQGASS